jgi:pimeloyl-ACP methyl ester carboxylesterase
MPANNTLNSAHLGNLFVNPGGPGGSAVELVLGMAFQAFHVGESLRSSYDIIGIDPRGVGLSTPVRCDPTIYEERISMFPKSEAEFEKLKDHNKRLGESCLKMSTPKNLINFVDTISTVKDLEAVRAALGGQKLNWLGLSYGTQIGSQYADLFPQHVGRMVLDGDVMHSLSETIMLTVESQTYETELTRFFSWCATTQECPLHGQDVSKVWDTIIATAEKTPIPALGCDDTLCRKDVNAEEIRFNVQEMLQVKLPIAGAPEFTTWADLGTALAQAAMGNATLLSSPIAGSAADSGLFPAYAIQCQDWTHDSDMTYAQLQYKQSLGAALSPYTKGVTQTWMLTGCVGWPAPVANPQKRISVKGAPTILLVNSEYDPSTSYVMAVGLREEIGNAVLLTRKGDGHTSYRNGGEAADAIDSFLVKGTLPAPGTVVES